jgi:hypothetical protein
MTIAEQWNEILQKNYGGNLGWMMDCAETWHHDVKKWYSVSDTDTPEYVAYRGIVYEFRDDGSVLWVDVVYPDSGIRFEVCRNLSTFKCAFSERYPECQVKLTQWVPVTQKLPVERLDD